MDYYVYDQRAEDGDTDDAIVLFCTSSMKEAFEMAEELVGVVFVHRNDGTEERLYEMPSRKSGKGPSHA